MPLGPSAHSSFVVSERYKLYLLFFLFALVYIRSLFGDFISLDDFDLVERLGKAKNQSLYGIFFGAAKGGLYYRPLLIVTHHFENLAGLLTPLAMRFDNLLLHFANSVGVYLLSSRYLSRPGGSARSWVPLWTALFFAFHPLCTESVNWISGRSDLLAAFFVLLSVGFLLACRNRFSYGRLAGAFICCFLAVISKEVALAFAPGMLLLLWGDRGRKGNVARAYVYRLLGMVTVVALFLGGFVYLRSHFVATNLGSINRTLQIFFDDSLYSAMIFFRIFGFYAKKLVCPWPLNLAIMEVDPLYDLLGIVVVLVLLWCFVRDRFGSNFYVVAAMLILPAYPIAFNQIAWTPFAERYLYLPLIFIVLGLSWFAQNRPLKVPPVILVPFLAALLAVFAITTIHRNGQWQTSLTLWSDTVEKSPYSKAALSSYAIELFKRGDFVSAEEYFDRARRGFGYNYVPRREVLYGEFLAETGRLQEAVEVWRTVLEKTDGQSREAYRQLLVLCEQRGGQVAYCQDSVQRAADIQRLYDLTHDLRLLKKLEKLSPVERD